MKMSLAVLVLATAVSATGAALGADLPTNKAPPAPMMAPPAWNWGGFYVGVNGGYGWGDTSWNYSGVVFFDTAAGQGFSTDPSGALLGGQIGYNAQFGSLVLGVEGSADWADLSQTRIGPVTPTFPSDIYKTKVSDIETLTGRVGIAQMNWLFYGKGGVATAGESLNVVSGLPISGVEFQNSFRLWGPTVGAGVEYMLTPNIILGLEYDYSYFDRGGFTANGTCTAGAGNCTPVGAHTGPMAISSSSLDVQSILARLSYKF